MPSAIKKLIIIEVFKESENNTNALTQFLFRILKNIQYSSVNDIEAKNKLSILFKSIILGYSPVTHFVDITILQQYFKHDGSPKYFNTDLNIPFPKYKKWDEGVEEIKIYYYIDAQLQLTYKSKSVSNERITAVRFRRRRVLPPHLRPYLIRL